MRSIENEECGKCGVCKMQSVRKCINFDRSIHFKAFWLDGKRGVRSAECGKCGVCGNA